MINFCNLRFYSYLCSLSLHQNTFGTPTELILSAKINIWIYIIVKLGIYLIYFNK